MLQRPRLTAVIEEIGHQLHHVGGNLIVADLKKYRDLPLGYVEKKIEKIERRTLRSKSDRSAEAKSKGNDLYEDYEPGQSRECVAIFNPHG